MTDTRTCNRGKKCQHPAGPVLPLVEFAIPNRTSQYANCSVCREATRRQKRLAKQRRQQQPNETSAPTADSVAYLPPEYQQAVNQWLLTLITRREGHPLTRNI